MFFNRILPKPAWLPEVIQRTTPEELDFLRSHPRLASSIAEFATVDEVLALLPSREIDTGSIPRSSGPIDYRVRRTGVTRR